MPSLPFLATRWDENSQQRLPWEISVECARDCCEAQDERWYQAGVCYRLRIVLGTSAYSFLSFPRILTLLLRPHLQQQGFSLDFGSQSFLLINRSEARLQAQAFAMLKPEGILTGTFSFLTSSPSSRAIAQTVPWHNGTFTYTPTQPTTTPLQNHFLSSTCVRYYGSGPGMQPGPGPWYLRGIPWWFLLFMVPIYVMNSAMRNLQPVNRKYAKQVAAMLFMACASYTCKSSLSLVQQYVDP